MNVYMSYLEKGTLLSRYHQTRDITNTGNLNNGDFWSGAMYFFLKATPNTDYAFDRYPITVRLKRGLNCICCDYNFDFDLHGGETKLQKKVLQFLKNKVHKKIVPYKAGSFLTWLGNLDFAYMGILYDCGKFYEKEVAIPHCFIGKDYLEPVVPVPKKKFLEEVAISESFT